MASTAADTISVPLTQEILDQCLNCPTNSAIVVPLNSVWNGDSCPVNVPYSLADSEPVTTFILDCSSSDGVDPAMELSTIDDSSMMFAKSCSESADCSMQRTVVQNRKVRPKALSTAPTVVELRRSGGQQCWCAFARRRLPAHSRFGPFDAPLANHLLAPSSFILAIPNGDRLQYLNTADDATTDWMKFVRPTRQKRLQNLEVVFCDGEGLFFDATRVIKTNEELRVWYSDEYEEMIRTVGVLTEECCLICVDCDVRFDDQASYDQHIQLEHDDATDDFDDQDIDDPSFRLRDRTRNRIRSTRIDLTQPMRFKLNLAVVSSGKQILLRYLKRTTSQKPRRNAFARRYYCKGCRLKFRSEKENRNHALQHELFGDAAYLCQFCGRRFFILSTLRTHSVKTHVMDRIFYCGMCNCTFSKESLLDIHLRSHMTTTGQNRMVHRLCPAVGCYLRLETEAELIAHVNHAHILPSTSRRSLADPSLSCRCEVCGRTFQTSSARISHMMTHEGVPSRQFGCPLCESMFKSPKLVKQHVADSHKSNGGFNCSLCDRAFDDWIGAQRHGRYHHAKSQYDCKVCGRQFSRSDKLRNHMTSHSNERPWLCEVCGARYKRKDKLKQHMKNHANDGHVRAIKQSSRAQLDQEQYATSVFRCELCLVGFKKRGMLVNHVTSKHRPEKASVVAPSLLKNIVRPKLSFACSLCPKTYCARRKLKNHVEKQHNKKLEHAESTVIFDGDVSEIEPYRCKLCPKEYLHKSHLLAHKRKDHPQQPAEDDQPSTSSSLSTTHQTSLPQFKPIAPIMSAKRSARNSSITVSSVAQPIVGSANDDLLSRAIFIADVDLNVLMTPPHTSSNFLLRTPNLSDTH